MGKGSDFHERRLYDTFKCMVKEEVYREEKIPDELLNVILHGDSRNVFFIPSESVHLIVTSPPYNVGKEYEDDMSFENYIELLRDVFEECFRILVNGGRLCVNVANVGRKPYIPYHRYIIDIMDEIGFLMRGEIIWDKGVSVGISTAWGSWMSAKNPTLRDTHEYVLVFSKGSFSLADCGRKSTIGKDEFLEYTKSVWRFDAKESVSWHPAQFPLELPYRCIQLYSFQGNIVYDPFSGSGTTALAALKTGRKYICVEKNIVYVMKSMERVEEYVKKEKGRNSEKTL